MLPLQQAREVRDSVIEYIKATFRFKEKDVSDAFYRLIESRENGLFKGPFISLKTPFISATEEEDRNVPLDIAPNFPPYKHQLHAFQALTMKGGHQPVPTLLTTGTGSGKTECFLYPILVTAIIKPLRTSHRCKSHHHVSDERTGKRSSQTSCRNHLE